MVHGHFALGLANFSLHLELQVNDRLNGLMSQFERGDHHIFGDFVRAAFHHEDGVFGAGNSQVEIRGVHFLKGRVEHELAVHTSHADRADRSSPGDV